MDIEFANKRRRIIFNQGVLDHILGTSNHIRRIKEFFDFFKVTVRKDQVEKNHFFLITKDGKKRTDVFIEDDFVVNREKGGIMSFTKKVGGIILYSNDLSEVLTNVKSFTFIDNGIYFIVVELSSGNKRIYSKDLKQSTVAFKGGFEIIEGELRTWDNEDIYKWKLT
ncbi:hypothetical protein HOD29_02620 [archaeon]|jgi:hypothetical protein|nr:hypothetical protein [archaeon]